MRRARFREEARVVATGVDGDNAFGAVPWLSDGVAVAPIDTVVGPAPNGLVAAEDTCMCAAKSQLNDLGNAWVNDITLRARSAELAEEV